MQSYKTDTQWRLKFHLLSGAESELKKFINEQKKYYEEYFANEFGKLSTQIINWEQYQLYIVNLNKEELASLLENQSKKIEILNLNVLHFLFAEIAYCMIIHSSLLWKKKMK